MNPMINELQMNVKRKEEQYQEQMTTVMIPADNMYICTINTDSSEISYTVINVDKKKEAILSLSCNAFKK